MIEISRRTLKSELRRIQRLLDFLNDPQGLSTGCIEKKKQGKKEYFYLCAYKDGKKKRHYLGKRGSAELRKAVSAVFRYTWRKILEHDQAVLEYALRHLWDDSPKNVLAKMPKGCREACDEVFLDRRMEALKAWAAVDYEHNTQEYHGAANYAMDGTRVRSKGEALWYDLLLAAGIPFRYECVITVEDDWGQTVSLCPDFMIQCYDGTMIIIEHLGGLDVQSYQRTLVDKLRLYQKAGYVVGDNLFLTSDDASHGTNAEMIQRKIREVEDLFYRTAA